MQSVAEGATAGVDWCQTLGQVSEQMDSLLDRQRGQRILPNKSRLLTKREKKKKEKKSSVTTGSLSRTATSRWRRTAQLNLKTHVFNKFTYCICNYVLTGCTFTILAYSIIVHLPHYSAPLEGTLHTYTHKKPLTFLARAYPPRQYVFYQHSHKKKKGPESI